MTGTFKSCIYDGAVFHRRHRPKKHKLSYRVFSTLLDLDELPALAKNTAGFSYNRFGLFSFHDRDHGSGTGEPLRTWVEGHLKSADISLDGGAIRLLCYPRLFGYVFNPLSVYFCYRKEETEEVLAAILYEVTNTFHERHTYLIPVANQRPEGIVRQACGKKMYVSPFLDMEMTYNFRIKPPTDDITVAIHETNSEGPILDASFSGFRKPFSSSELLKTYIRFPLMTLKIIGGIHWEALKLWAKGVPVTHHPKPPTNPVTVVGKEDKMAA